MADEITTTVLPPLGDKKKPLPEYMADVDLTGLTVDKPGAGVPTFGERYGAARENATIQTDAYGWWAKNYLNVLKEAGETAYGDADAFRKFSSRHGGGEAVAADEFLKKIQSDPTIAAQVKGSVPANWGASRDEATKRARKQFQDNLEVSKRAGGAGAVEMFAGFERAMTDEVGLATAVVGLFSGGSLTTLRAAGRVALAEGALGAAGELATIPAQQEAAAELGIEGPDVGAQVLLSGGISAAFPMVGYGVGRVGRGLTNRAARRGADVADDRNAAAASEDAMLSPLGQKQGLDANAAAARVIADDDLGPLPQVEMTPEQTVASATPAPETYGVIPDVTVPPSRVVEAGNGYTVVEIDGQTVRREGARNWRNNNPGNLEYGVFARSHGAIGTDGRFAVFPDYETGRAAKEALLFDSDGYRGLTVEQAIRRYAPPSENDTGRYVSTVSGDVGITADTPLSSLTTDQRSAMLDSMERIEGFQQGAETRADGSALYARPAGWSWDGRVWGAAAGRADTVSGLGADFEGRLANLINDAPPEIRTGLGLTSGYRSVETQQRLWDEALVKYGSAAEARKWVAPPGRSQHGQGNAVDLAFNGARLDKAPAKIRAWVHANAGKYGLHFPMGHEPWHVEPIGARQRTRAQTRSAVPQDEGPDGVGIRVRPSEVGVDSSTYQFKGGVNETGADATLTAIKKWNDLYAGQLIFHERLDGSRWVADGHQRWNAASRLEAEGHPPIYLNGVLLREADGITAQDAMVVAAKRNIAQGSGDALDQARILRRFPDDAGDLAGNARSRDALGLAKLSDEAFNTVNAGKLDARFGGVIGEATADPREQIAIMKSFIRRKPSNMDEARFMASDAVRLGFSKGNDGQASLFGGDFDILDTKLADRAKVANGAERYLRKNRQVFRTLARNASLAEAGGNVLNRSGNAAAASEADGLISIINALATRRGPVSDALDASAAIRAERGDDAAVGLFIDALRREEIQALISGEAASRARGSVQSKDAPSNAAPTPPELDLASDTAARSAAGDAAYDRARELVEGSEGLQRGVFGPIFTGFRGKWREAIDRLRLARTGEAPAALNHPDVGDIALVWGEAGTGRMTGFGLAKIEARHPEMPDDLQGRLTAATVESASSNRIILDGKRGRFIISRDWKGQDTGEWLLSAYERKGGGEDTIGSLASRPEGSSPSAPRNTDNPLTRPDQASDINAVGDRQDDLFDADQIARTNQSIETLREVAPGELSVEMELDDGMLMKISGDQLLKDLDDDLDFLDQLNLCKG